MDDIAVSVSFVGEEEVYELLWTELLTLDYQPISDFSEMTEGMKVMAPWICDKKTVMTEATILSLDPGMYCVGCFLPTHDITHTYMYTRYKNIENVML